MTVYLIGITCERAVFWNGRYSLSNCKDPVEDCRQPLFLRYESDSKPNEDDIDGLVWRYRLPRCSQTGCERFLSNHVCLERLLSKWQGNLVVGQSDLAPRFCDSWPDNTLALLNAFIDGGTYDLLND